MCPAAEPGPIAADRLTGRSNAVGRYLRVLRLHDFRSLWLGATVSLVGDGMTFVALSWLVVARPGGASQLGLLGVCYTAPVLAGGLAVGPLLDRFDKRRVLLVDCLLRAVAVGSIPLSAAIGGVPLWLVFAVASFYGLLKMVPLAGFPAAIPALVAESDLDTANALESLSFSMATMVGPAMAGLLVGAVGAANVLLLDSASYLIFAAATRAVRRPLPPVSRGRSTQRRTSLAVLRHDRVIVGTTLAFMAFNVAEGMLLICAPWLARNRLSGGPAVLGALLAATAAGEFAGAALAGARRPKRFPVRSIGFVQFLAALGYLALLTQPREIPVGTGFFLVGLLSAPMTVWAQSLRMRRIPAALHGRAFAALRTLMQATPPAGAVIVAPMLARGQIPTAAVTMAVIAGIPGLLLVATPKEP